MLILIAESKTMTRCDGAVSEADYRGHRPALEDIADDIMHSLRGNSAAELAAAVKISANMVARLHGMIYDFPNKTTGARAIEAFTGVVFRAFGYPSLDERARRTTNARVRIISSLYGWLRPDDFVKAYRFDFTTALAPGGVAFATYHRPNVTEQLIEEIRAGHHSEVLNLLPGDAIRCIDFKRVESVAKVLKADFREVCDGGELRTPTSNRLKILRGELLRRIVADDIDDAAVLPALEDCNFMGAGCDDSGTITYHCMF